MTISTTSDFNPDQAELFEDAFELAGVEFRTGNDVRTAKRSLDYLLLEWANEGLNLWTIEEDTISLVAGTQTYDVDIDVVSILDAVVRTDPGSSPPSVNQADITAHRMSSTSYAQLSSKLQQGRPNRYWFDRRAIRDIDSGATPNRVSTLYLWPVPDVSTYEFVFWSTRRMADAGTSIANTMEVPDRFLPALLYGMAYKIALKKNTGKAPLLFSEYTRIFELAKEEDRVKEDLRIVPELSYYDC